MLELIKNELPTLEALFRLHAPNADAATAVMQELEYLQMRCSTTPAITECTPQSIVLAVKSVIRKNLTLDPSAGLVYMKTRNVKVVADGKEKWIKVLEIEDTANGLISHNRQLGRILHHERPHVTKENGKVVAVKFRYLVPSPLGPLWEEPEFDESDFFKWRKASHKENRRAYDNARDKGGKPVPNDEALNYANPNYTNFNGGIDPEFARAKAIKHGLKKLGTNSNERPAAVVPYKHEPVVDIHADQCAAEDDATYIPHEEINL